VNIFFDVDETLIAYDGSLRPGTRSVLERLVSDGHHVYIWSGRGIRATEVHRTGLGDLVSGIYQKPLSDFTAGLARCGIHAFPDFVVDDYPGIVEFFGGLCIRPYHGGAQVDSELADLPELVRGLGSASAGLREAAAPHEPAPRSRPDGRARSWPCRCSHGRCTLYWGLCGLVMIVDVSRVAGVPERMLAGRGMRRGTVRVGSVPRSPAVRLIAVAEPGPPLRVVRGELPHDDDLVPRSGGHGDRDTRPGTRPNAALGGRGGPGHGRRRAGTD
jgi:haloacid dehalogenase-like hydrolase